VCGAKVLTSNGLRLSHISEHVGHANVPPEAPSRSPNSGDSTGTIALSVTQTRPFMGLNANLV